MSALGEMATAVAHELLNPLTGVKTALQLLRRTHHCSPDVHETVTAVDAEIQRVEQMARRLVSFSRPAMPQPQPCDLDECCRAWCRRRARRGDARRRRASCRALNGVRA